MLEKQCVQGRWIDAGDVQWLRGWIESNMQWSRKRIARELCLKWDWKDQRGRIKDFAARSFLLKLQTSLKWVNLDKKNPKANSLTIARHLPDVIRKLLVIKEANLE